MRRPALALVLALGAGCGGAPPRVSLSPPAQTPKAGQYVDILKRWTRHGLVRSDFDEALDVDATFRAPEFRAAYAEKWITTFRIGSDEAPRTREQLINDGADTWEFHVETATHTYELNDLASPKSVWRVTLVDDGGHEVTLRDVQPTKMRRELETELYPYASLFSRGWRLRFPRELPSGQPLVGPQTKSLTLRFAGPQGSLDLTWFL